MSDQLSAPFPTWPSFEVHENAKAIVIRGKHVSYRRYIAATLITFLLRIAFFFAIVAAAIGLGTQPNGGAPALLAVFVLLGAMACTVLATYFPYLLAYLLFPKETCVQVTRNQIIINGMAFSRVQNLQFLVGPYHNEDAMADMAEEQRRNAQPNQTTREKMRYRRIYMFHNNTAVIPIASVRNLDRANQMAMLIQRAHAIVPIAA